MVFSIPRLTQRVLIEFLKGQVVTASPQGSPGSHPRCPQLPPAGSPNLKRSAAPASDPKPKAPSERSRPQITKLKFPNLGKYWSKSDLGSEGL